MLDERVIPGRTEVGNVMKHIARYNFVLQFCGGVVADLSCGVGYGSWLMSKVADRVIGVDIDEGAVEEARREYGGSNIEYRVGDVMDFKDKVDLIVSLETTEHLEDLGRWEEVVGDCSKFLFFSVPLNEPLGWNEHHKHVFTLESARRLFPKFTGLWEGVQRGVNIGNFDASEPYTYYLKYMKI